MASKISFERNEKEQLINLVQQRPWLYLKTHEDYRNSLVKANTWEKIAQLMKRTAQDCQTIWKSLREQYLGYLRKLKKGTGSASGHVKTFSFAKEMEFCVDKSYTQTESNFSNLDDETNEDNMNGNDMDSEDSEAPFGEDSNVVLIDETGKVNAEVAKQHGIAIDFETPKSTRDSNSKITSKPRVHSKYQNKRQLDPIDKKLLDSVDAVVKKCTQNTLDEYDLYCQALAPKLRRIAEHSKVEVTKVQFKIYETIFNSELETLEQLS